MPLSLPSLPEDIVFEIVIHLGIPDTLSLLETCVSLRAHFSSQSMWIVVLNHARKYGACPLPCPPKLDLTKLDLPSLQQIGLLARRLEHNLDLPRLQPVSPILSVILNAFETLFTVIPGTKLIITYDTGAQKLCCWDMAIPDASLARRVCSLDVTPWDTPEPAYFMEDGKYIFALEVDAEAIERPIYAICVDFRDRDAITMRVIFKNTIPWNEHSTLMFIDDQVIGVLVCDDPHVLSCMVFNMKTHHSVTYTAERVSLGVEACSLFRQNLYIFHETRDRKVLIHHIPPEHLPYSHTPNSSSIQIGDPLNSDRAQLIDMHDLVQDEPDAWHESLESSPAMLGSGVYAVTIGTYYPVGSTRPQRISFCFWPMEVALRGSHGYSPLTFSSTGYDHILDGCLTKRTPCTTGANVVVCMRSGERGAWMYGLRLLRFVKDPDPSVVVSELDVPLGSVDLSALRSVAMDDHLGLVFLVDSYPRLFCIAYA